MKYGRGVTNFGEYFDPAITADLALDAEKTGWDGGFLSDHILIFKDFSIPVNDPWITLSAATTPKITQTAKASNNHVPGLLTRYSPTTTNKKIDGIDDTSMPTKKKASKIA